VTAATPHPESLRRHDPETNRRFIAIFEAPENAEVVRMLTMGLAINDPERPAEPVDAPRGGTDTVDEADSCPCMEEPDHVGELARAFLEGRIVQHTRPNIDGGISTSWEVAPPADGPSS
jgi:hypothetical protein